MLLYSNCYYSNLRPSMQQPHREAETVYAYSMLEQYIRTHMHWYMRICPTYNCVATLCSVRCRWYCCWSQEIPTRCTHAAAACTYTDAGICSLLASSYSSVNVLLRSWARQQLQLGKLLWRKSQASELPSHMYFMVAMGDDMMILIRRVRLQREESINLF